MEKTPLYTIGHGNRKSEDFLALLHDFSIDYLVDVRSQPYSRFNPQFNREALRSFLEANGIRYVFMGDSLGGRPKDASCYAENGKVDYETVMTKEFFRQGIERLKTAYAKDTRLALMCSESKPGECHRTHLIGKTLSQENIALLHIDEEGQLKNHAAVIGEIKEKRKGAQGLGLWEEE